MSKRRRRTRNTVPAEHLYDEPIVDNTPVPDTQLEPTRPVEDLVDNPYLSDEMRAKTQQAIETERDEIDAGASELEDEAQAPR